MGASRSSGTTDEIGPDEDSGGGSPGRSAVPGPRAGEDGLGEPSAAGSELLAALLDGMDAALCAFDADGTVTHWNREAERVLGWSAEEAVGRSGFAGWAVRRADAEEVRARLMSAMDAPGRQVHEFALLRKDGGRVLVRTQSAGVRGADGKPAGVYCAFSEVHAQIDLERAIALSEALMEDASWGVVLVDVDLRPTVVNTYASRALGGSRSRLLGRPLGEVVVQGVEELEAALQHVLAEGAPAAPAELWVTLRTGVGWLFRDVTAAKLAEQEADRLRFRTSQLHRAARTASECEDPMEAATSLLDFALAGFADHVLVDLVAGERLVRTAATPSDAPGPCLPVSGGAIPARYAPGHPALQAVERTGTVRTSGAAGAADPAAWAVERRWPRDAAHALCAVLRSRGRTLGVLTFLRAANRAAFERTDTAYAETVAARVAGAVDLARATAGER
nr:PAS domain-containing protein [Streptomyces californicus]